MDKETALYWKEIIEKAEQNNTEALILLIEENRERFLNLQIAVEDEVEEVLNPKPEIQREWWQLPPIIDEWP